MQSLPEAAARAVEVAGWCEAQAVPRVADQRQAACRGGGQQGQVSADLDDYPRGRRRAGGEDGYCGGAQRPGPADWDYLHAPVEERVELPRSVRQLARWF